MTALKHTQYQVFNLSGLDTVKDGDTVDAAALAAAGLVKKSDDRVKLLSKGEVTKKLTVKVTAVSAAAKKAVEAAGGTVEIVKYVAAPKKATRPQAHEEQVTK